jgi:hypothetical protein
MLLAAMVCAPGKGLAAASVEDVRGAVKNVFDGSDYQRELPFSEGSGGGVDREGSSLWDDPNWWRNEGETQAPDLYRPSQRKKSGSAFDLDLPPALVEVLRVLMWGVMFVGGALIVYYLLNEARLFSRWKKNDWQAETGDGMEPGQPGRGGRLTEDYDELAARGDYAGAVHALLLSFIARLRERGATLSSSMTSREILRRLRLEDHEKEALSVLVRVTELTHFGGRGATEAEYRQCRDLYQRIANGETA